MNLSLDEIRIAKMTALLQDCNSHARPVPLAGWQASPRVTSLASKTFRASDRLVSRRGRRSLYRPGVDSASTAAAISTVIEFGRRGEIDGGLCHHDRFADTPELYECFRCPLVACWNAPFARIWSSFVGRTEEPGMNVTADGPECRHVDLCCRRILRIPAQNEGTVLAA
jgi:hypothetical protein